MISKQPKNLNLFTIRLPLPALVSILHRMSGVLLFLLMPFLSWALCASLSSVLHFNKIVLILNTWPIKVIQVCFIWALIHHLMAGLRHLLLDLQVGNDLIMARFSSKTVLLISFILTVIVAYWL
ncbi:succinate dehydrogenase, cytochrome b556 subunit [Methylophilaceae bacterium]|nr:succinate dehydrogenase, cytochrome b556 subunit [Methylophilaceae bacterium]